MDTELIDCLYGKKSISQFYFNIILSPELQRLRYVRLSNINSLTMTGGSEINRFEHSLGVFLLANEWLKYNSLSLIETKALLIASLLHDIQTSPFGHSIQYIYEDNYNNNLSRFKFEHQNIAKSISDNFFQNINHLKSFNGNEFKLNYLINEDILKLAYEYINGSGTYGALISGSMDFDNIDSVIRLSHHIGLLKCDDKQIPLILAQNLKIKAGQIFTTKDTVPIISRLQEIRKELYTNLLTNLSDFSAKAMLTYAVENAVSSGLLGIDTWRETDNNLLYYLSNLKGEYQIISLIIKRLISGDLFHPLLVIKTKYFESYNKLLSIKAKREIEEILSKSGIKSLVIFHPIIDNSKTERQIKVGIIDSSEKIIIGNQSDNIFIGIFISKLQTSTSNSKTVNIILDLLYSFGIKEYSQIFPKIEGFFDDFK